jgi:hypothetical protein
MRSRTLLLAALSLAAVSSVASAAEIAVEILPGNDPQLTLKTVAFDGGKALNMTVGVGSALFRRAADPAGVFWSAGDRGPNFTCDDAEKTIGIKGEDFCGANAKKGRIYPVPDYVPSIYKLQVDGASFKVAQVIPLKTKGGKPVSGLLNPLTVASTETPIDAKRQVLEQDPNAVDLEGLVVLADGSFWLGEENGPSILHVGTDGTILERLVPAGTEQDFAKTDYPVKGVLPAVLATRALNRGIESMTMSADESTLFFIMQNPLANPDTKAYAAARNTRLFAFDRKADKVTAEYVYQLDPMDTWKGEETKAQSTPRISELLWLAPNRLIVDERTEKTTKLHLIDLTGATGILGTKWDDKATAPSLEQSDLTAAGIVPVSKQLLFDTAGRKDLPVKIEGVANAGDGALMLINDDDFGIENGGTKLVKLTGLPLPK